MIIVFAALQEVLRECCGFSCYIACWRPDLQHRTQAINYQTGRPRQTRDASFYQQLLVRAHIYRQDAFALVYVLMEVIVLLLSSFFFFQIVSNVLSNICAMAYRRGNWIWMSSRSTYFPWSTRTICRS